MTSGPQLLTDLHQLGDFDSGEPSLDDRWWLEATSFLLGHQAME